MLFLVPGSLHGWHFWSLTANQLECHPTLPTRSASSNPPECLPGNAGDKQGCSVSLQALHLCSGTADLPPPGTTNGVRSISKVLCAGEAGVVVSAFRHPARLAGEVDRATPVRPSTCFPLLLPCAAFRPHLKMTTPKLQHCTISEIFIH